MAGPRPRSSSPAEPERAPKRQKLNGASSSPDDLESAFVPGLFDEENVKQLSGAYESSEPYKHSVLQSLFDDELLRSVKDEILRELRFAEKETDIYKVHQTGDLASLNYLEPAQLALFPSLLRLRNALYSPSFRHFLRNVTGCGPLSGSKQDMSVNSYRQGCHLLNHDDVIGTRRVSYILYMPLPLPGQEGDSWREEWGGALELYPVLPAKEGEVPEPSPIPSKRIPPSWNQFVFFEVQPGQSFHSVEEVVVGTDKDGVQRLSISGWFHKAQDGEPGYGAGEDRTERMKSSLEQLSASAPAELTSYPSPLPDFIPSTPLTEFELSFLSDYLNPVYLQPRSLMLLAEQFREESSINLKDILCEPLAQKLETALRARDSQDGLGPEREPRIPAHASGVGNGWKLAGPPHKHRYCVLDKSTAPETPAPLSPEKDATALLRSLQSSLLASTAFRAWLGLITSLIPLSHQVSARRFRPGLDYTLAQAEEDEARLDVCICLTPQREIRGKGKGKMREKETGWEDCAWGGWECYMAPHEGEEDPAVYRSGSGSGAARNGEIVNGNGKVPEPAEVTDPHDHREDDADGDVPGADGNENGAAVEEEDSDPDADGEDDPGLEIAEEDREALEDAMDDEDGEDDAGEDEDDDESEDEDDEDDTGTLLTAPASFNGLLVVLRDAKLMRFVKYVSAAAEGSRWDVYGEWQVGDLEEDDEELEAEEP